MAFTGASPNLTATITRAGLPLQALNGVRKRRLVAVTADLVLVSIVVVVLWTALLVLTFGLSLVLLPPLFPVVAFFYNGLSVSGHSMATPGMRLAGIQLRMDATGDRGTVHQCRIARCIVLFQLDVPARSAVVALHRGQALPS